MQITIDATLAGARNAPRSGIYRYLTQLLRGFAVLNGEHDFRLWFNAFWARHLDSVSDFVAGVSGLRAEVTVSRFPARVRDRTGIPADRFLGPADIFHSPNHLLPRLQRIRGVVTIHDLAFWRMQEDMFQLNAEWCAAISRRSANPRDDLAAYEARCGFFRKLQRDMARTLSHADGILAVSEATARDLADIGRVPRARIRVVPNGLTPGMTPHGKEESAAAVRRAFGIRDPYILYLGVLEPNKDLHTLIRAMAATSAAFRRTHQLVIAGSINWFRPVLEEEADRLAIGERVRFLGFVPDAVLPTLYSGASASVSPCPLEGFGFPVLESMACGTPGIVVDAGSLPEVAGDAALRVPPSDPDAMASAIERVATDADLAADLRKRGLARCREFSWERTAKMTLEVYREVAG
jgi:glycosyltransferase involved in cell wall biosynthesis